MPLIVCRFLEEQTALLPLQTRGSVSFYILLTVTTILWGGIPVNSHTVKTSLLRWLRIAEN